MIDYNDAIGIGGKVRFLVLGHLDPDAQEPQKPRTGPFDKTPIPTAKARLARTEERRKGDYKEIGRAEKEERSPL